MFIKLDEALAHDILSWEYPLEYDLYNMDLITENIIVLLKEDYYGYLDNGNNLIGFACFGPCARIRPLGNFTYPDGYLDIGLGLRPSHCEKNMSSHFIGEILDFGLKKYRLNKFRLSVASFNQRAMDLKKTYDCVFMISGSFALITDYDLGIKALKNFKKHLKTGGRLVLDLILPENFRENTSYSELFKINNKRAIFFTQYYENIDYKSQVIHQLNRYELWENNSLKTNELSRFDLKWYGIEEFVNILKSLGFKDISYEFGYGKDGASSLVSFSCTKK